MKLQTPPCVNINIHAHPFRWLPRLFGVPNPPFYPLLTPPPRQGQRPTRRAPMLLYVTICRFCCSRLPCRRTLVVVFSLFCISPFC